MAQPWKRRGHAIASHFGRLWVSSWHVWSQLCTCEGCTTRLVSLSLLLTHRLPALYLSALGSVLHREGTWPLVSHLQTCSVVKGDFFAFLYSGFSWISHPYLWCRTESCWLSGPTLQPFLWTNVTFVIFPSLGINFDLSDRLYATWGHPAISYLNSLIGKCNVVLESC